MNSFTLRKVLNQLLLESMWLTLSILIQLIWRIPFFCRLIRVLRTRQTDTIERGFYGQPNKLLLLPWETESITQQTLLLWSVFHLTTRWWTQPCPWIKLNGKELSLNWKTQKTRAKSNKLLLILKLYLLLKKLMVFVFSTILTTQTLWMK